MYLLPYNDHRNPGLDIHDGGMWIDCGLETSLLNAYNQRHGVKNVVVTDGAAMTSTGTQNMALTARTVAWAAGETKRVFFDRQVIVCNYNHLIF